MGDDRLRSNGPHSWCGIASLMFAMVFPLAFYGMWDFMLKELGAGAKVAK
jgi:hypothetical protein